MPACFKDIDDWVKKYRTFREERFERLDYYLRELQQKEREEKMDDKKR